MRRTEHARFASCESDLVINIEPRIRNLAERIKLAIFDVDGVLTDGSLVFGPGGEEYKIFNSRDGHGLVMLGSVIDLAIITGRESSVVEQRMEQLGIKHVYQGQSDKRVAFEKLTESLKISPDEVCYVGDDIPDLVVMREVGLAVAPADANWLVRESATWCTQAGGGRGAVREVCDLILLAHDRLGQVD